MMLSTQLQSQVRNYFFCLFTYVQLAAATFPFFFSSRRRHTRFSRDWSSDVCSSDPAAGIAWTPSHLAVAALAIACCAVVVFAVLVLGAALTFYTLQGSEAVNVVL